MSTNLTISMVYLDEGEEEGGIAHPTRDLIEALSERIGVREVPITRGRSADPRYWFRLGRRAASRADVVHIQFEYGSFGDFGGMFLGSMFPIFARGIDVPITATLHNFRDRRVAVSLRSPRTISRFLAEHATWFVDRSLVRHGDYFIPLMKAEVELLRRHGVPDERIEYIPLVPTSAPEFRDVGTCKRALDLADNRVITAFGWVRRTKGYHRVLNVLPELPPDVVFLVAGGTRTEEQAAYLQKLRERVKREGLHDRVKFTGYVGREEHPTIMNATDVMVFPYLDNRASDALARALSYHLPVVASDNEEFSAFEEEWGCVRTVTNDQELLHTLKELLENSSARKSLEERASAYATQMNWENVASRMVEIYRKLAAS